MDTKPKISVITPSKNGGRFLRQTLDSISQQSFTDYEHVVADSASTDDTLEILQEYQRNGYNVRWISEPDRHTDEGFYKALTMARGELIMLCCVSDGYLDRNWFRKCVEVLENDTEVSLVYGLAQHMSEDGTLGKIVCPTLLTDCPPQKTDFFPFWLGTFALCPESTFCVRADVFKRCFPKYEPSGCFLENHALLSFNYNFNINGYLPYFLPVVASHGRYHHDSNSKRLAQGNRIMKSQYKSAVIQYGNKVLSGRTTHVFRDGKANVVKTIEPHELKRYRQKVLDYRINRKFYLGKRKTRHLRYWIRKCKILMGYLFCQQRMYD
jgi:glycosyltransferase involved in cell wall biosynthesis